MNSKPMNKDQHGISKDDIHLYQTTKDEQMKHSIEKKSLESDFDADALDGWSENSFSVTQMKSAEQVISGTSSAGSFKIYAVSIVGLILLHLLFTYTAFVNPSLSQKNDKIVKIEKSDVQLPKEIASLEQLPEQALINPIVIKKDFKKAKEQEKEQASLSEQVVKVDETPIVLNPTTDEQSSKLPESVSTIAKTSGKEVYLSDLKLLDYRAYRSKPSIKTQQAIMTGTPADQSGFETKNETEFEWKNVDVPYVDYLEKTMVLFSKGNNKKALMRFEEILKTYSDDVNALFYAGLCYYNLGEFEKAISSFHLCVQSKFDNFDEEAEWYEAKSYLANKNLTKANELFSKIVETNGYYSSQAKVILKNQK